jgi:hypothetical protein
LRYAAFLLPGTHLKATDIARSRLASQQISSTRFKEPGALVAHMGALQAQDHASMLWAIGLRVEGATLASVRAAIAARQLARTWMMRGTLHVVAAGDVRWMLALLGERNTAGMATRHRQLELDDKVFAACRKLLAKALCGTTLARTALFDLLEANGIATGGQRGIHILWRLSQDGLLCFADHIGKQPAFALLDDWAPDSGAQFTHDEALAQLAGRYFGSHGPATVADFAWWSGLTLADAKRGLAGSSGLESVTAGGKTWIMAPGEAGKAGRVFLLPGFDEYLLGYKDRGDVLDPEHAGRITPGGNGVFKPMIVANGRIAGTWQRGAAGLAPEPFAPLSAAQSKALASAAARYRAFCADAL